MSSSTIPYCAVEERRRLNRCMENASDDYEKEIYRKIRDMPVPYEKFFRNYICLFDYLFISS